MSKNISRTVCSVRSRITITRFKHLINRLNNRPINLNLLNKMYNIRLSALDQTQHTQNNMVNQQTLPWYGALPR